ncbi:MAG TPA: ABC transporter permease [Candidatus Bathyarchaeia archaeon]|nr:ABC transporter permease [Candidatus Bathyarchaeia archaeon]
MKEKSFFKSIKLSFKRMYSIISGTALDWLRTGPAVFFTFIYPIIMILLFGYIFGAAPSDSYYSLYYFNEDTYVIGDQEFSYNPTNLLLHNLGLDNESIRDELNLKLVNAEYNSSALSIENWMKSKEIPYMIVIPSGWSAAVNESKLNATAPVANIHYYFDPSYTSSFEVQSIVQNVLAEMNLVEFGIPTLIQIDTITTPERESLDYIDFYVPGIIMVTISTSGMMGMVSIITTERQSGMIFKISSTPIKKWEWALAHETWQAIIGIVVAFLTIITGWIAFGFNLKTIHPLMIPILIFGTMTFAGMALIIARFVKRPEAAMAATMSIVFPQMFLSGALFPAEMMPNYLNIIAKFFPLHYIAESMRATMLESTFHNVWLPFGITIAMGIGFFVIGSLITVWRKE